MPPGAGVGLGDPGPSVGGLVGWGRRTALRVLVDTYNVLHLPEAHVIPDGAAGLIRFSELIAGSRFGRGTVVLMCDGRAPGDLKGKLAGGVRAAFSGDRIDADTAIKREIAKDSGARDLIVVSSDREVQRAARRSGARVVESGVFFGAVMGGAGGARQDGREGVGGDDASASWWMRAFGFEASGDRGEALDPDDPSGWGIDGDWWAEP